MMFSIQPIQPIQPLLYSTSYMLHVLLAFKYEKGWIRWKVGYSEEIYTTIAKRKKMAWRKGESGNPNGRPKSEKGQILYLDGIPHRIAECDVRERFRVLNEIYNWFEIAISQTGFPDFILKDENGNIIRAEAEATSSNFKSHGHSIEGCDLIICWKHTWKDCPLPVLIISIEWFNYLQLKQVKLLVTERIRDQIDANSGQ